MTDFSDLFALRPVNGTAARVVRQGARADDAPLSRAEMLEILKRLERKHRLLKLVLGIRTKAQQANVMRAHSKGWRQFRRQQEPRAFAEYVRVGGEIQRFVMALAELKAAARRAREMA